MDRLDVMLKRQRELQFLIIGDDPCSLEGAHRTDYIKDMVLALTDELHELLSEVGWKPWATSKHVNREEAVGELIDAWHFMLNLMNVLNVTGSELYDRYEEKRQRNIKRREDGYDGVTGKCPGCHRDFGDIDKARRNTSIKGVRFSAILNSVPTEFCSRLCASQAGAE